MALILSLESSARYCSAALHSDGVCIAEKKSAEERRAAAELAPACQLVMDQAGVQPSDLHAVAVASGPGSYTGLRIASSLAKGIVVGLSIPLISVGTLHAIVRVGMQLDRSEKFDSFCSLLDARRMEIYCQWFGPDQNELGPISSHVLTAESFLDRLESGRVLFIGDAVEKCASVIQHPNAYFQQGEPDARSVGELAWLKFQSADFEQVDDFEPMYLKEFLPGRKSG